MASLPPQSAGELAEFSRNVFSQNGEDGILWEILNRLDDGVNPTSWCVEFGAWDGVYLSNTCNLIRSRNYRAVLIEGDSERVRQLEYNHPGPEIVKVCRYVSLEGEFTLDRVLQRTEIPQEFDVLSIDVDGFDYWVFDSLQVYSPRIVVIEFNPTIPNSVSYVQEPNSGVKRGASARALTDLGRRKGFDLVAVTSCNLILVRSDLLHLVGLDPRLTPELEELRDDSDSVIHAFVGFDGTLILSKELTMPWHGFTVSPTAAQPLPRMFRKYPGDWGRALSYAYRTYRLLRRYIGQ